ncbi:hypothetical protein [Dongia deserti]|uniref:hypothetical protein n=1 Tax=Dongia deserti TaxID=2268030 RepID=UPI0013C46B33|nr:hypothetical protein [Dongia deserti]
MGLGAAGIAAADIPAADALQIGAALATDVLGGGQTSALDQYRAAQQPPTPAGAVTATRSATAESYQQDQVTITCPSGVSSTIPLSYKTQACREAMITFAKVYSCNMIDDMNAAASACQGACGNPQCRE